MVCALEVRRVIQRIVGRLDAGVIDGCTLCVDVQLQIPQTETQEGTLKGVASCGRLVAEREVASDECARTQIVQMLAPADENFGICRHVDVDGEDTGAFLAQIQRQIHTVGDIVAVVTVECNAVFIGEIQILMMTGEDCLLTHGQECILHLLRDVEVFHAGIGEDTLCVQKRLLVFADNQLFDGTRVQCL